MKKLIPIASILILLNACVSTFLIPDKMVNNDLGNKIENCINQDEDYLRRQFGKPTKVDTYDPGIKMVYYEEWGHWYTKRVGNTQYYVDYRFIKFTVDSEGFVEKYFVSEGYDIKYNANKSVQTLSFWAEMAVYIGIGVAIGII